MLPVVVLRCGSIGEAALDGGERIAEVLRGHGVPFVFTLCGGHISPILVGCTKLGIRVVDVRHEVTAVFAADAVARLTGIPGVAAVTAGPGVTNTITAVKNAQLAQSSVVLLGGATATALDGRGALQDIDQLALFRPHVKWARAARRVRDLAPLLEQAFAAARSGVPGPVFLECPVDLLYPERVVRDWYGTQSGGGGSLRGRLLRLYLRRHLDRLFAGARQTGPVRVREAPVALPGVGAIERARQRLRRAERPLVLIGSQALLEPDEVGRLALAVERLGAPVFLSGMARGLLGPNHPLHMRHRRKQALRQADTVVLAGTPCDFRLNYGRHIPPGAFVIAANRSRRDLTLNRRPDLGLRCDPGRLLRALGDGGEDGPQRWVNWRDRLRESDRQREQEILAQAGETTELLNPLQLCREIDAVAAPNAVLVADGGDFVATASYIVAARGPLSWLDPGPFGTLGVGAGFALGAKLCRPDSEVWILYGDGSAGYSLAEFDTFARHGIPVLAIVGNDAAWMQIERDQVELLGSDVACRLARTDYHDVAAGLGGRGFLLTEPERTRAVLERARQAVRDGRPALVNAHLGKTDFRKGSISI